MGNFKLLKFCNSVMYRSNKEDGILRRLMDEAMKGRAVCCAPGCIRPAIKSHYLQQHGVLSHLETDGFVVQWSPMMQFSQGGLEKKSVRKSWMMTFRGFCAECDKSIFAPIEDNEPDFNNYRHLLLFSYRGIQNELRKLEWLHTFHNAVLASDSGVSYQRKKEFELVRKEMLLRLYAVKHTSMLMEHEVFHNKTPGTFGSFHKTLPKVDIAASGCLGNGNREFMQQSIATPYSKLLALNPLANDFMPIMNYVVLHLIPTNSSLEMVVFWHRAVPDIYYGYASSDLPALSNKQLFKLASDLILSGVENWVISDALHKSFKNSGMDELIYAAKMRAVQIQDQGFALPPYDKPGLENLNIFDGLISGNDE